MSQSSPKVSVIIPVYNVEKYLRACLDSVVNQTLKEIEIICVDDGSTDSSLEILREYEQKDERVHVLTQKNLFAGVARNHGMEKALGEYCVFWDSDDFFELFALELLYKSARAFNADICLCGADKYDMNQQCFVPEPWWLDLNLLTDDEGVFSRKTHPKDIFSICNSAPWNKIFSRKFIMEHRLRFQALPRANDVYFVMSALGLAERIAVVDQVLIHYRVGGMENLQSNNYKSPLTFCEALTAIKEKLVEEKVFDEVNYSFRNLALAHCNYNMGRLKEYSEVFESTRQTLLTEKLQEYHVNTLTAENCQNKKAYLSLCRLLSQEENAQSLFDIYESANHSIPTVSIIIPVYNMAAYLDACLSSVCGQTFQNIEIICVDDKSTDNSLMILRDWAERDPRIKIIAQPRNTCQGGARNSGLEAALGKYVWFIDSDDEISPDAVETLVSKMEELKDVDLLSFNSTAFKENGAHRDEIEEGRIIRRWPKNQKLVLPRDNALIPSAIEGSSVTVFSRRTFIDSYRFRKNVSFEDADFMFDALTSKGVFYELDYAPYHRRIHDSSTTGIGAAGQNANSVLGRLLASKEIVHIIQKKKLKNDHYAVIWAKRWMRFAVTLYAERPELHDDSYNQIAKELQSETGMFSSKTIYESTSLRSLYIPEVIVSLTSHPKRIGTVHMVIEALINQTVLPDRILLYLSEDQFMDHVIPNELQKLQEQYEYFKVCFREDDLKPHKKYFYAVQEYPDAIIITVDDDVLYHNTVVEELLDSYLRYPDAVSVEWGHTISFNAPGKYAPYKQWQTAPKLVGVPSYLTLPVGVGGCLYPPHVLPPQTFDQKTIKSQCLFQDDLWLKWNLLKRKVKCIVLKDCFSRTYVEDTQDNGLWNINARKNDAVWQVIKELDSDQTEDGESISAMLLDSYMKEVLPKEREQLLLANKRINQQKKEINKQKKKVTNIRSSVSYRIGRAITWLPRKVRGGVRCLRQHGMRYTFAQLLLHLHLGPDNEKRRK